MASYYMDPTFGEKGRKFIDMVSEIPSPADICELATSILHRLLGHKGLLYDAVKQFKPKEFVLAISELISDHYIHDLIKDGRRFAGSFSENNEVCHGVQHEGVSQGIACSYSQLRSTLRRHGSQWNSWTNFSVYAAKVCY
jgi:hypothetical protein